MSDVRVIVMEQIKKFGFEKRDDDLLHYDSEYPLAEVEFDCSTGEIDMPTMTQHDALFVALDKIPNVIPYRRYFRKRTHSTLRALVIVCDSKKGEKAMRTIAALAKKHNVGVDQVLELTSDYAREEGIINQIDDWD